MAYKNDYSDDNFKSGLDSVIREFKKKMLGKIINFWKTEVNGKIK